MVDLHQHLPRADLGVPNDLVHGGDRSARHAGGPERLDPCARGARPKHPFEHRDQLVAVADAVGVGPKAWIVGQGEAGDLAKAAKETVVARPERDVAPVCADKRLVRNNGGVRRAPPGRNLARGEVDPHIVREPGDLRVHHRHVEDLAGAGAAAGEQREDDRVGGVHAARDVGDRDAHPNGPTSLLPGRAHDATHPLEDQVERGAVPIGAALPEPRDRAVDQPRVAPPQDLVADPQPAHRPRGEVLDHHVRPINELQEERHALGMAEVEGQAQEVNALPAHEGRPPGAGSIAFARRLDLQDIGPVIPEHRGAEGTRHEPGQVDHPDPFERGGAQRGRVGRVTSPGHLHQAILAFRRSANRARATSIAGAMSDSRMGFIRYASTPAWAASSTKPR